VHRIDLPRDVNLSEAWSLVRAPRASPAVLALWQRNGLRVGVLESAAADSFPAALPAVHGHKEQLYIGSGAPLTLRLSAMLREPVPVRSRVDGGDQGRLVGGQCRLRLHTTRLESGRRFAQLRFEHGPMRSKRAGDQLRAGAQSPRPDQSDTSDGAAHGNAAPLVLKDLSLVVPLDSGQMIVMGRYDTDELPQETEEAQGDSAEPSPAAESADDNADGPDRRAVANNLGRTLFTDRRAGREVQVLILIASENRGRTKAGQ
jgi:hypothetical protein